MLFNPTGVHCVSDRKLKKQKITGISVFIRLNGLIRDGLKVSGRLQKVKIFLHPCLTYGFLLFHAKKVKKKNYKRIDLRFMELTFRKRFSIQIDTSCTTLTQLTACGANKIKSTAGSGVRYYEKV